MNLSKEQIGNILWIVVIVLVLFTPIGFHLRVMPGRVFASEAQIINADERQVLHDYKWKLVDLQGNTLDFDVFGDCITIVNFWSTYCPPCIAELPGFVSLYNDYKDKVDFVFLARDEPKKVVSFLDRKKYALPVYFENSKTPDLLYSKSIPATFVLGRSGELAVAEKGLVDWDSKSLRRLLDELLLE